MATKPTSKTLLTNPKVLLQLLFVVGVVPFLPIWVSRDWGWVEAWIYGAVTSAGFMLSRTLVGRKYPDLLAERASSFARKDTVRFDKVLAPLVALGGTAVVLAAGIDRLSSQGFGFSLVVRVVAGLVVPIAYAFGTWAMLANRFFSGTVRVQRDRGHEVVDGGPYRWLRHPGYAAALANYLATPLLLDSLVALALAIPLGAALVVRTALEDRFLRKNLPGYDEYAKRVRHKLLPFLW